MTTKTTRQLISLANLETVTGGGAPIASPKSERLSAAASFLDSSPTMLGTTPEIGVMPCHLVETAPQQPSPGDDCCGCEPCDSGDEAPDLDADGDDVACDAGDDGEAEPDVGDDDGLECSDDTAAEEPADPESEADVGDDDGFDCSDVAEGDEPEAAEDAGDSDAFGCADASDDTGGVEGVDDGVDDGLSACPPAQEHLGVAGGHLEAASLVTATFEAVHPPCGTVTHAPVSRFESALMTSLTQPMVEN